MWQWWKCDNDVPEDCTDYHLNYGDGDGDDYWNDDDGDKWKVLCWLSSYCPPLSQTFFPKMLVMLNNVSGDVTLLALSVIVVMDAPSTLSATDKLPLYGDWIFARSSISCLLWLTLTSDEHTNKMKYNHNQDIKLSKEPCILPKEFSFSDQHQEEVLCWPVISYQQALSKRATGQKVSSTMQEELITRKRCQPPRVARSQWSKRQAFFLSTHHRGETMSAVTMSTYRVVFLTVPPQKWPLGNSDTFSMGFTM